MFKIFAATVLVATVVVAGSTAPAVADTTPTPSLTYSQAVSELIFEANNVDDILNRIAGPSTCVAGQPCLEDNSPQSLHDGGTISCQKAHEAAGNLALFDDIQPEVTALAMAIDDACTGFDDLVTQLGLPDVNSVDWKAGATALHEDLVPQIQAARAANPLPTPPAGASPTAGSNNTPAPPDTGSGESREAFSSGEAEAAGGAAMLVGLLVVTLGYARRRKA
ncbi:hypothetical protein J0H33_09885 [bacterium]|nr:hypothetical protein [bacterium]